MNKQEITNAANEIRDALKHAPPEWDFMDWPDEALVEFARDAIIEGTASHLPFKLPSCVIAA